MQQQSCTANAPGACNPVENNTSRLCCRAFLRSTVEPMRCPGARRSSGVLSDAGSPTACCPASTVTLRFSWPTGTCLHHQGDSAAPQNLRSQYDDAQSTAHVGARATASCGKSAHPDERTVYQPLTCPKRCRGPRSTTALPSTSSGAGGSPACTAGAVADTTWKRSHSSLYLLGMPRLARCTFSTAPSTRSRAASATCVRKHSWPAHLAAERCVRGNAQVVLVMPSSREAAWLRAGNREGCWG